MLPIYNMETPTRFGKRWTVNEYLQLQREFELLELSVAEIACRHKRTPNAIIHKLVQEGFADYNVLYSNHNNLNAPIPAQRTSKYEADDRDYDGENEKQNYTHDNNDEDLKEHIMRLEKQVMALTEMFMNSNINNNNINNKSVFSLFA